MLHKKIYYLGSKLYFRYLYLLTISLATYPTLVSPVMFDFQCYITTSKTKKNEQERRIR